MKTTGRLLGALARFSFEQRIFHFATLLGVVLTAVGALLDVYYGANVIIDILFTIIWALIYYFSRFKGYFKAASRFGFAVLILAFFPYLWVTSGGIRGGISYYAVIIPVMVCIVLSGRLRMLMLSAMLLTTLSLILLDTFRAGPVSIVLNMAVQLLIVMAATGTMLIVYTNIYMKEKERSEAYAKAVEQNLSQQIYYMETLEDVIGRLKSERHDFNHHLGVMYALLEDCESDKARNYAASLVDAAREYRSMVNIPYSMLRAMLNYKLSAARERGITLHLDINLPSGLKLNEADLTVILGNLIDNAMEACAAVEKDNRYIGLSLAYRPDYLIIQTENPSDEETAAGGKGKTTKTDKENHGFGLRNIEYLVQKHSGIMKLEPEPGVFKISLALLVET
jgi:sensor histidine kinase YesM